MSKELGAGQELDELVAERVMGWQHHKGVGWFEPSENGYWYARVGVLQFSSILSEAWIVVDKLRTLPQCREGFELNYVPDLHLWRASCREHDNGLDSVYYDGYGETVPLAICQAALKAVE